MPPPQGCNWGKPYQNAFKHQTAVDLDIIATCCQLTGNIDDAFAPVSMQVGIAMRRFWNLKPGSKCLVRVLPSFPRFFIIVACTFEPWTKVIAHWKLYCSVALGGRSCWKLFWSGGTQCLDSDAQFVDAQDCREFMSLTKRVEVYNLESLLNVLTCSYTLRLD